MKEKNQLLKWSKESYSHLPWREKRSLYRTLVSEIMLQQTTVGTVLNHFDRFISEYPTINDLANTTEEQICISWKGLGYYRRARNLRKAAIDIRDNFNSKIPTNYDSLISITGIGEYTANAIISIGNDEKAFALDANLERVLSRIFGLKEKKGLRLQKLIKKEVENKNISFGRIVSFRDLNEALMDLGRVFCQARKVNCDICPMRTICIAYQSKKPLSYPEEPVNKIKKYFDLNLIRFVNIKNGKVLGYIKDDDEWLSGQVELPTFVMSTNDDTFSGYPKLKTNIESNVSLKTSITKYKINNYIVETNKTKIPNHKKYQYFELDINNVNFATTTLKVLKKINVIE